MRIRPRNVSRVPRAPKKSPVAGEQGRSTREAQCECQAPARGCGALRCLDSIGGGQSGGESFCTAHARAPASIFNLFGSFLEPLPVASLVPVLVPVRTCMGPAHTLFSLYGNVTVRRGNRSVRPFSACVEVGMLPFSACVEVGMLTSSSDRDTGDFMGVAGVERLHEMGRDVGLSPPFVNRTHMAGGCSCFASCLALSFFLCARVLALKDMRGAPPPVDFMLFVAAVPAFFIPQSARNSNKKWQTRRAGVTMRIGCCCDSRHGGYFETQLVTKLGHRVDIVPRTEDEMMVTFSIRDFSGEFSLRPELVPKCNEWGVTYKGVVLARISWAGGVPWTHETEEEVLALANRLADVLRECC